MFVFSYVIHQSENTNVELGFADMKQYTFDSLSNPKGTNMSF